MMQAKKSGRFESVVVFGVAAILAIASGVLLLSTKTNTQDWENWVEIESTERLEFEKFKAMFGSNDYVIASWPGCTIDDPRLDLFSEALAKLDQQGLIKSAVNGKQATARITERGNSVSADQARHKLQNIFFGSDLQLTCTAIELSVTGSSQRRESIQLIEDAAKSVDGLNLDNLKLGGNAHVSVELDRQTNRSMLWAVPACLTSFLIGWLAIGHVRMTLVALAVAGLSALFSMSLVAISGNDVNGLLVLMPVLVLTVTLSSAIHLLGYYRFAVSAKHLNPENEMIRLGWRPAMFAMSTSAIGVGSLFVGKVPAVSQFGIYSACSILIGLILLCLLLPNALRLFVDKNTIESKVESSVSIGRFRAAFLKLATTKSGMVIFAFVSLLIVAGFGLTQITSNLDSSSLFSKQSKFSLDSQWFDDNVISLETVEAVVTFGDTANVSLDKQLRSLSAIQTELGKDERIKSTFSIVNFFDRDEIPPADSSIKTIAKRATFNHTMEGYQAEFMDNGLLAMYGNTCHWRVTLCCNSSLEIDFDDLIADCEHRIGKIATLTDLAPEVTFTGMAPIAWRGHQQLFDDLTRSFLLALCIITPMMMFLLRTIVGGLVAMIPNIFPPFVLFGLLGWSKYSIDVGMILTASVGLGIAVDNTFHFLHQFRSLLDQNITVREAVCGAFKHCSRPMLQTTFICCCGLAFFAFADFVPVKQFALAIVAILILALLADILLLPALATLKCGRLFAK